MKNCLKCGKSFEFYQFVSWQLNWSWNLKSLFSYWPLKCRACGATHLSSRPPIYIFLVWIPYFILFQILMEQLKTIAPSFYGGWQSAALFVAGLIVSMKLPQVLYLMFFAHYKLEEK